MIACLLFPANEASPPRERMEALAEACYRLSPSVAVREGEAIFLDEVEVALLPRIRALGRRFELGPRVAFGASAGEALARARYGLGDLPLEALNDYVSPFRPDPVFSESIGALVSVLQRLGIARLAEFLLLPAESLASRFGEQASWAACLMRESALQVWPRFVPSERVVESADFALDGCGETLDPLFFAVRGLADRALARLRARAVRVSAIELRLGLERGEARRWRFDFPIPQGSSVGLLPLLRERMGFELERTPLGAPVASVRLEVVDTAPGRGAQRNFFHRQEEDLEAWEALIARLSQRIGASRVFLARLVERYLPERAWKAVRADEERFTDAAIASVRHAPGDARKGTPPRPTRILARPEPLRKLDEHLVSLERGTRWRVARWEGPERLSGEWWTDPGLKGFQRDYFRVQAETGERLWVYAAATGFFLHGYFD